MAAPRPKGKDFGAALAGLVLGGSVLFLVMLTIVWLIALYAVVFGVLLIGLGWRLRGVNQDRRSSATT